jgi:hypothetical protein
MTLVATVDEQNTIVIAIPVLDELAHTEANGYRCTDHTCPCFAEAQERRNTAALNGNKGFSLLR